MALIRARDRDLEQYRDAERALWHHHGLVPREHLITADARGTQVRAVEFGAGRPVVFVHGLPSAGGVFAPLVAQLPGVRAIVVDRPGCGLSDPLDLEGLTPERLQEFNDGWLMSVVDELGSGPVDLLGSSAGGMAVLAFAVRHPHLVRTLTLDGTPAIDGMRLPAMMRAAAVPALAGMVARRPVKESDFKRSLRNMGHSDVFDEGPLSAADVAWRIALANHTHTFANEFALLAKVASWRGLRAGWVPGRAEVAGLTVPSLWVAGDQDPFASADRVKRWAGNAPGATWRYLPGAGHQPWLDDVRAHARMLEEFWEQAPTRPEAHPEL